MCFISTPCGFNSAEAAGTKTRCCTCNNVVVLTFSLNHILNEILPLGLSSTRNIISEGGKKRKTAVPNSLRAASAWKGFHPWLSPICVVDETDQCFHVTAEKSFLTIPSVGRLRETHSERGFLLLFSPGAIRCIDPIVGISVRLFFCWKDGKWNKRINTHLEESFLQEYLFNQLDSITLSFVRLAEEKAAAHSSGRGKKEKGEWKNRNSRTRRADAEALSSTSGERVGWPRKDKSQAIRLNIGKENQEESPRDQTVLFFLNYFLQH